MKVLINLLILLSFLSCQKDEVKIELLNKNLKCKIPNLDSLDKFYQNCYYENENDLKNFTNVISFKVCNETKNKQLLFLNSLKLNDIYNINIIIEDNNGSVLKIREPIIDASFNCELGSLIKKDYYDIEEKKLLLEKIGYKTENSISKYYDQGVVINKKESLIFNAILSLPFVVEDKIEHLRSPIYFKFNPKLKYTFKIIYELKENVGNILPKEMIKFYNDNNIEIFKGKIETQKIPIIFSKK